MRLNILKHLPQTKIETLRKTAGRTSNLDHTGSTLVAVYTGKKPPLIEAN